MDIDQRELYVDSIEFSYSNNRQLLSGVYLHIKIGEIVGLLGRNGSGKSTLMKIIFGTLKPKFAYIRLHGKRIHKKAFLTNEVCYLPQQNFLPTAKTVDKVVHFMVREKNSRAKFQEDGVLKPIWQTKIADLSGGELRYLEILLLLNQKATFFLLDEPFSGVSPVYKEKIQNLIVNQCAEKGFLISDHDYTNVLAISNKILLLQNGGCRILKDKKELELFYVPEGTFDT
ncbi:ATP-binding cassette domain-containing protein [Sphingobacterium lumbrici]|uniref:ATP-binding cassette domain-containing protein n=1 Tax=Sphingobacterium lumbrici TaxID=2559600 RepID=UPI001128EF62|nr:ABC transporter ATP-binding protein [Sphingobacterium lumbrici]